MGCDIHVYIEKKKKGKWIPAQGLVKDEYGKLDVPFPDKFYTDRNYQLFGFLTGGTVRRGIDNTPLPMPKGLPKDISPQIKAIYDKWAGDAHSTSYFTLKELKSVKWDEIMIRGSGLMDKKQWKKFSKSLRTKKPDYSLRFPNCQGTTIKTHVPCKWKVPATEEFKYFLEKVDFLYCYDWTCKENEIRMVFWFDN